MSLFDNNEMEAFLLFVCNFNMKLAATVTQDTDAKVQYLCTIVCGEALNQFDLLYADVENSDTSLTVDYLLQGIALYFPL